MEESKRLYDRGSYSDYLYWHGFITEVTEAFAEYGHLKIRDELGIADKRAIDNKEILKSRYRGKRYSFGYPSCPDLEEQVKLFKLLQPERIGISLTEIFQLIPELSTSAIIVHNPQAKYFMV